MTKYGLNMQEYQCMKMSSSDKKQDEVDGGSGKKSKKKQKKQDTWRPQGPRDPFELVCVFV